MSSHWIKSIGAKFIYISRNLEKPVGFGLQTRYSICDNPWVIVQYYFNFWVKTYCAIQQKLGFSGFNGFLCFYAD